MLAFKNKKWRWSTGESSFKMMHSQNIRKIAPEFDPLRIAAGKSYNDLSKPNILIESTAGESSPGSIHLFELANKIAEGITIKGGSYSKFYCTDICDGIIQSTDAMRYSLKSRDLIADVVELHYRCSHSDGAVLLSSCDKSIPAHIMALAKLNVPSIFLPGGVQEQGPGNITLENVGTYFSKLKRGKIKLKDYEMLSVNSCPTAGACAFIGTACTMQILAEALGLALPGSALLPAYSTFLQQYAIETGKQILNLVSKNINSQQIITKKSLRNAIVILIAIGGSTNAVLHLSAIAKELKVEFDFDFFNRANEKVPFILNMKPSGKYPASFFWMTGGVPSLFIKLQKFLSLDALTVTGENWNKNLSKLEKDGYFKIREKFLKNYGLKNNDLIKILNKKGSFAILKGNIAPEGCLIKYSAIEHKIKKFTGRARVFDSQKKALAAIYKKKITPGSVIVIRYEGLKATGMPEMFYVTEAIASDSQLSNKVAIITDGRFSGASRGICVCHISPEAAAAGPIARIKENDMIEIDLTQKKINKLDI